MAVNPLFYDSFFKVNKHNSQSAQCRLYQKHAEQIINLSGIPLYYFPVSEYDLDGVQSLWGEDPNKKYLEKYTLKGITEGENDLFGFNRIGVDKTIAQRVVYISKKAFTEITGRQDPLESDMFLWTQNNIVYEITEVTDQDNIVLGQELTWKLVGTPRLVEGEIFGLDDCNNTREDVPVKEQSEISLCDKTQAPVGDGNVIEDPDNVTVPGPSDKTERDNDNIDADDPDVLIRTVWGGWNQ